MSRFLKKLVNVFSGDKKSDPKISRKAIETNGSPKICPINQNGNLHNSNSSDIKKTTNRDDSSNANQRSSITKRPSIQPEIESHPNESNQNQIAQTETKDLIDSHTNENVYIAVAEDAFAALNLSDSDRECQKEPTQKSTNDVSNALTTETDIGLETKLSLISISSTVDCTSEVNNEIESSSSSTIADESPIESGIEIEPEKLHENKLQPIVPNEQENDESDDDWSDENLFPESPKTQSNAAIASHNDERIEDDIVQFYRHKKTSLLRAIYDDQDYAIDFLDLTAKEKSDLDRTTQWIGHEIVSLTFKRSNIHITSDKLSVKRIRQRETAPNSNYIDLSTTLGMERIQFSNLDLVLAKYKNQIYFVGDKLREEYLNLLRLTRKNVGIAIRLKETRIKCDNENRTVDLVEVNSYLKKKICIIPGQHKYAKINNELQRYIVSPESDQFLIEIDPKLIHSSIYDDCAEIYAGIDFPWETNEMVPKSPQPKKLEQPEIEYDDDSDDSLCDGQLKMAILRNYKVPKEIEDIERLKKPIREVLVQAGIQDSKRNFGTLRRSEEKYIKAYRMMIQLEEVAQTIRTETHNIVDQKLTFHQGREFYIPVDDNLLPLAAAIEENEVDWLELVPKDGVKSRRRNNEVIKGEIRRYRDKKIYIRIFDESFKTVHSLCKTGSSFNVNFKMNRTPYQLQHYALDFVESHNLFGKLINNPRYYEPMQVVNETNQQPYRFGHESKLLIGLNTEQRKSVEKIITKKDKLPYVLYGPPGTGKTRTLVAAIEQIVKTTNDNVLVCAQSNAACDEIAERLIKVLTAEEEMYRFYARSYKFKKIDPDVRNASNWISEAEGFEYPALKMLYKYRVIICTLCTAGCLTRARKEKKVWRADHFSYVFIDECASTHETAALISIAGLCTTEDEIYAKIIMAGDPKQLDAVTISRNAEDLGYRTSLLEHLCKLPLYQRDEKTKKYNNNYITQLVKNYRSHPAILKIPNERFYENTLKTYAAKSITDWYIDSKFLPSKKFPIVFKSVQGVCQQTAPDKSSYNKKEIDEVKRTIKNLLPPNSTRNRLRQINQIDIGVVTPYRKQSQMLVKEFRYFNFDQILVGTAEIFQGKEKPIMIVSTVRSSGSGLGFVAEWRRFNVVITRAKCLLVVIGDPHTLCADPNWAKLLKYCLDNNSFEQSDQFFSI